MTSDLFTVMDGFNAGYSVSVEGDSVSAFASGEVVTINAEMAGESKITVTGTASMSTSSLIPSQTVSNVASLTFPVMVVDTTLVVTLSAEPMEIEAGGTTMITATANRAVTVGDGAVEIALAVVPRCRRHTGSRVDHDRDGRDERLRDVDGQRVGDRGGLGQRRYRPHAGRGDRDRGA